MMKWKRNKINYIIWSVTAAVVLLSFLWITTSLAAIGDDRLNQIPAVGPQSQVGPRPSGPICGPYVMMEADLYALGYNVIGAGIVNNRGDKWILFQQIVGPEPLKWVILVYINEGYEGAAAPAAGFAAGTACEINVGINWNRYSPIIQE